MTKWQNWWLKIIEIKERILRLPAILFFHHGETFGDKLAMLRKRMITQPVCANCHSFNSAQDKWEHWNARYSATNAHTVICSFSGWQQKLLIYTQVFPWMKNKMAAITRYEIGEFSVQNLLFNIYGTHWHLGHAFDRTWYILKYHIALWNKKECAFRSQIRTKSLLD